MGKWRTTDWPARAELLLLFRVVLGGAQMLDSISPKMWLTWEGPVTGRQLRSAEPSAVTEPFACQALL